jgi:hypothetical protein
VAAPAPIEARTTSDADIAELAARFDLTAAWEAFLERQAAWQRARARLSWGEKLRASVAIRRSLISLRKRAAGGVVASANRAQD